MIKENLEPIGFEKPGFAQRAQDVGNCTWASSKVVLLALLIDACGDETIAREIYKDFTEYARDQALEDYKNRDNPYASEDLIAQVRNKISEKKEIQAKIRSFSVEDLKKAIQRKHPLYSYGRERK